VISVIVYGRNDAHGYNMHRRVALSLNCVAEVLTDPDDEILFVDYNTPDQLPTLIEAIADTLTDRCLSTLRVLRVRPAVHQRRYAAHTHLTIVEPVARNVAARNSNPENRWLLSTTTDMVLVPRSERSLTQACADLPNGYYGLPRFELPEWLWEQIPRSDPRRAITEISRLGPALRLDETTTSHEEMRFDAPGDFQLVLREDFFAIDGFDEAMLLGWHVDTNLSKRIFLRRGSIESLEQGLAGYHCNHHRTPTVYHGTALGNDLGRFFYELDQADIPDQRATWGMAGEAIEFVSVGETANVAFASAALAASESRGVAPSVRSDATQAGFSLEYDSRHTLPFIVDALRTAPQDAAIAYIGANSALEELVAAFVATWNGSRLLVPALDDPTSVASVDEAADVFVVDLGVDAAGFDSPIAHGSGAEFTRARAELVQAYEMLRRVIVRERARLEDERSPRRFVLVNSAAEFWNAFVLANLECGSTTPHSRVRSAVARLEPVRSAEALAAQKRATQLVRWIARDDSTAGSVVVEQDVVRVRHLADYSGFGSGWWYPDWEGIWTRGARSELALELGRDWRAGIVLTLAFDAIRVSPPGMLAVTLLVNGASIATRTFTNAATAAQPDATRPVRSPRRVVRDVLAATARRARAAGVPGVDKTIATVRRMRRRGRQPEGRFRWSVSLPEDVSRDGKLNLVLTVEEPFEWEDDRRLGLYLSSLEVEHA
jgi:GT2 family glycosyltransferase